MRNNYNTNNRKYSIFDKEKIIAAILLVVILILIGFGIGSYCFGEEPLATCYAMCKPGSRVEIRISPSKESTSVGFAELGDSFFVDGTTKNGWVRCYGIGDGGGWIYSGYVATEKPDVVMEQYVCVAKKRVACRRWMAGPQIDGRAGWLNNGDNVTVFAITSDWAVTSRGYIKSIYLERDPE